MDVRAERISLDPERFRRFLTEQLEAQQAQRATRPERDGTDAGPGSHPGTRPVRFDLKPEELEEYLDQYVVGQHAAKAILATKICTHFHRLKLPAEEDEDAVGGIKNNVLLIGPTGVGKTYLIKLIARKLGVPFVKGDATKFSETGYVGGDVEDLVRDLVREADGDIERAQHGIIYIDEIDKIASSRGTLGPDVSRAGVQRNLLKLMEDTDVDLKVPHDLASQMETVMQLQRTGKVERRKVNTRSILFIVSGAFAGLEEIVARRLNRNSIGFRMDARAPGKATERAELLQQLRAEDLIEYGFESEFIGRLPVIAVLHELSVDDLLQILRSPRSSVILAKKRDFRAYGIDIEFTDEGLRLLAQRAYEEHTGARGLVSVLERVLIPFEKKLPSLGVTRLVVTEAVVRDPRRELDELVKHASLARFVASFGAENSVELSFSEEAAARVLELAAEAGVEPAVLCNRLFADYAFGLRLARLSQYRIERSTVDSPNEELDRLVRLAFAAQAPGETAPPRLDSTHQDAGEPAAES